MALLTKIMRCILQVRAQEQPAGQIYREKLYGSLLQPALNFHSLTKHLHSHDFGVDNTQNPTSSDWLQHVQSLLLLSRFRTIKKCDEIKYVYLMAAIW